MNAAKAVERFRRGLLSLCIVVGVASATLARAEEHDSADVASMVAAAERAEDGADPQRAYAYWQRALLLSPSGPLSQRCSARIHWLHERSEHDFAPLTLLMRAQIRPPSAWTRDELRVFEREVNAFPNGIVREEARAFAASEARSLTLESANVVVRALSFAAIAAFLLLVAVSIFRARRLRRPSRTDAILWALCACGPLAMAWLYDASLRDSFAKLSAASASILVLSSFARDDASIAVRRSLAALSLLAIFGASYIILASSGFSLSI